MTVLLAIAAFEARDADAAVAQIAGSWAALRTERNARLAACDWTQIPDAPLTVEQKAAWATYRQALRDLPDNTADPANPTWPEAPQ